jgi:hypothetical protein
MGWLAVAIGLQFPESRWHQRPPSAVTDSY